MLQLSQESGRLKKADGAVKPFGATDFMQEQMTLSIRLAIDHKQFNVKEFAVVCRQTTSFSNVLMRLVAVKKNSPVLDTPLCRIMDGAMQHGVCTIRDILSAAVAGARVIIH